MKEDGSQKKHQKLKPKTKNIKKKIQNNIIKNYYHNNQKKKQTFI
jgi:hypothetical protein